MIFNIFEESDIVTGRTAKVSSGFWPEGTTNWSQELFVDDFWDLTGSSATPSPSYGTSFYDVRRTMYYLNIFPSITEKQNNDPYFSIAYGHVAGSGSFANEMQHIKVNPTKTIYTQYKNILLGMSDLDGRFSFKTGSAGGSVDAVDIFVISFSTYKMKDRIDEGIFQISFSGSNGCLTFVDDSSTEPQIKTVYNLISGSLESGIHPNASYEGVGLLYPQNGLVVINAEKLNNLIGMKNADYASSEVVGGLNYNSSSMPPHIDYTANHKVLAESLKLAGNSNIFNTQMNVRKSEYIPARHYFIRVKNRDFNYSNNPTYVYDGQDPNHAQGTIRNSDFITDPKTYPTTVGLYNSSNELVAVAKLSRPAVKSFDNELLIKCRLDF